MRPHRVSVALVAATSVLLGSVSPALAQSATSESSAANSSASNSSGTDSSAKDSSGTDSSGAGSNEADSSAADSSAADSSAGKSSFGQSSVGQTSTAGLSEECAAAVKQARLDHEQAVANGDAGSSFMGPQELAFGLINGYGSSGMPEVPDCIADEAEEREDAKWDELPEELQSFRGNETSETILAVLSGIVTTAGVLVQAAIGMARISPEFRAQVKDVFAQFGIKV